MQENDGKNLLMPLSIHFQKNVIFLYFFSGEVMLRKRNRSSIQTNISYWKRLIPLPSQLTVASSVVNISAKQTRSSENMD